MLMLISECFTLKLVRCTESQRTILLFCIPSSFDCLLVFGFTLALIVLWNWTRKINFIQSPLDDKGTKECTCGVCVWVDFFVIWYLCKFYFETLAYCIYTHCVTLGCSNWTYDYRVISFPMELYASIVSVALYFILRCLSNVRSKIFLSNGLWKDILEALNLILPCIKEPW